MFKMLHKKIIIFSIFLVFSGVQCGGGLTSGIQAGVHFSADQGQTWTPKNLIIAGQTKTSLARFNILTFGIDPLNPDILFVGTDRAGLYRSSDKGETWNSLTTEGQIQSISINPKETGRLAAARQNQIFVSDDNGAVWKLVYTDPSGQTVTDIKFDYFNDSRLYAALASGEMLKSSDKGKTWTLLYRFDFPIHEIFIHPQLENRLYVLAKNNGLQRTDTAGKNWYSISDNLNNAAYPVTFIDLDVHPRSIDSLLLATTKGLFISNDAGGNWQPVNLLTTAKQQRIYSAAWDPQSRSRIFYTTPTVFYVSSDSGKSWQTTPFSSKGVPNQLIVNPKNSDYLYITTLIK